MSKTLQDFISEQERQEIFNLYQNNVSIREIAKKTHHGRHAISKMLTDAGVKTTVGNHYRKYFFDVDYFEKIDTSEKAYWLGFMYADGCIEPTLYGEESLKLAVGVKDIDVLQKFKQDLKSTYPIRFDESRHHANPACQGQGICCYKSQKAVNDLISKGCVRRKSLILEFPTESQVPKKFIYDFIRGYFDGDGSISYYERQKSASLSFVGTKNFIMALSTYFKGGSVFPDKRKKNSWYFNLGGKNQIIQAYSLMYSNATRYMDRKYNKFQEILKKYNES